MAKLAILGHETRGHEVIEILEMLGGKNNGHYGGSFLNCVYFINNYGHIEGCDKMTRLSYFQLSLEEFLDKFPYKVGDKVRKAEINGCIGNIVNTRWDYNTNRIIYGVEWEGINQPGLCCFAEDLQHLQLHKEEIMEGKVDSFEVLEDYCLDEVKIEFDPSKYELVWKNNGYYVVKRQPKYPKTYEECYEVLGYEPDEDEINCYRGGLIEQFVKLLLCRDAYWQIAGEEIGLNRPWKPDWLNKEQNKFVLYTHDNVIMSDCYVAGNNVLAFPTKIMRDAFKENFGKDLEACKELL